MKRRTKLGLAVGAAILGTVVLSSCTQSFCSPRDIGRMKYAFEPGISRYEAKAGGESKTVSYVNTKDGVTYKYTVNDYNKVVAEWDSELNDGIGGYVFNKGTDNAEPLKYLNTIIKTSYDNGYVTVNSSSLEYFSRVDDMVFEEILLEIAKELPSSTPEVTVTLTEEDGLARFQRDFYLHTYAKFISGGKAWANWDKFDTLAREDLSPDACPSTDFVTYYKSALQQYVAAYRTCQTTRTNKYGSYGYNVDGIYIEAKPYSYAWSVGSIFEGLLVWPIGALVDVIDFGFMDSGLTAGVSAFLAIVIVTFIIRSLMLLLTFKQTQSNAKMTELQPEIQKIQNKYPNANTSQTEKQRMAEEMNRLYKKHKINPFMTIIVMIVQFPVFICVWGALSGSAALTNGSILGLKLSLTIREVLFDAAAWTSAGGYAAVTALILFLLMAGAQTVSMLVPQWIQKRRAKKVEKLGKNPAQQAQNSKMKWFTYIMLAMIIFMGFSLVSAMGIYWFIGALFSLGQTLVTQLITDKKKSKSKK